jgi:TetR/AcrR family transcriptional regulator, ethionamide resistance regulator
MATPTRARARQQPDETRTLILDTAEELLRTRPFRELSVDEVMRPTGYGRTVFYRHFTGLPDLVLNVLTRVLPAFAQATRAFIEVASGPMDRDQVRELLRPVVEHWAAHGVLMRAMRDAAVYDQAIDTIVVDAQSRFHDMVVDALERRREAGVLQTADLRQVSHLLEAMNQRYLLVTFGESEERRIDVDTALDTLALGWLSILNAP